jgi:hypothetical protein
MESAKVTKILINDGSNATGLSVETGQWRESGRGNVVVALTGSGNFSNSVAVQGSHDQVNWVTIGTVAPDQAAPAKTQAIDYPWPFMRAVSASKAGTITAMRVTLAQ